jgi:hypothetical protein
MQTSQRGLNKMQNIDELLNINTNSLIEGASKDEVLDILNKMQKLCRELNINVKDLKEGIKGYERNNNRYHYMTRKLTEVAECDFDIHYAKTLLNDVINES